MYLSPFIIVIQQNGGLAASICLGLIVIVTIATTAVTSMCFWRARAALSRSVQHHQQNNSRDHQDHELIPLKPDQWKCRLLCQDRMVTCPCSAMKHMSRYQAWNPLICTKKTTHAKDYLILTWFLLTHATAAYMYMYTTAIIQWCTLPDTCTDITSRVPYYV